MKIIEDSPMAGLAQRLREQPEHYAQELQRLAETEQGLRCRYAELQAAYATLKAETAPQRSAEAAAKAKEARYRHFVEGAPEGIWTIDTQGISDYVNEQAAHILGYQPEEIIGRPCLDFIFEEDQESEIKRLQYCRQGTRGQFYSRMRHKDGSERWLHVTATTLYGPHGEYIGALSMFSERSRGELELNRFFSLSRDLLCVAGFDGFLKRCNPAWEKVLGYSSEALRALPYLDLIHPDDLLRAHKDLQKLREGQQNPPLEIRMRCQDGSYKWFLWHGQAFPEEQLFYFAGRNITERRQAEEQLRQSEARYRRIVETTGEGIWTINDQDKIDYVNRRGAEMLGYKPDEMLGRAPVEFLFPEDIPENLDKVQPSALSERRSTDFRMRRKDGSTLWIHCTSVPIYADNGDYLGRLAMGTDMTDSKMAQDALRISEERYRELSSHLQSIAEAERTRIAREIHDELGARLTAVKMDVSWCADQLVKQKAVPTTRLTAILDHVDQAIHMVRRIATDLRPSILDHLGLWAAIDWLVQDIAERTGIRADLTFDPAEPVVDPDETRATALFRIVQEALTNVARHSHAAQMKIHVRASQDEIMIEIKDDGVGITEEQILGTKSYGIRGMAERIGAYRGEFIISGLPSFGTTLNVRIPMEERS